MAFLSVLSNEHNFLSGLSPKPTDNKKTVDKVLIFIFSDGLKSQFTNAKPLLDKYGFKGTFDVVCNNVDNKDGNMNWKEIKRLHNEGHDIGSHGMSHVRLTNLSKESVEYEVGESKKCLQDYGIKPSSFEYPYSTGSEDKKIVEIVAKHYEFATRGNDPLMFLRCDGLEQYGQKDCKTYNDNGTPTYANKYSIRNWSHDFEIVENSYSDQEALERFIEVVNSQSTYNNDGTIEAIPIIMYHDIGDTKEDSVTDVNLFEKEMKYLHDHKFKVITISDLAYDEKDHSLYIKDLESETELPVENVTAPTEVPTINATTNVTAPTEVPTINATTNVTAPTEVPTINATTNVTAPTEVPTINATTNVTAPTEVPTINATTNVTAPTEVPTINATTNVTAPTEVPTINATTNVTAPTEVPTINATTNVTAPTEVPTINATTNVTAPTEVPTINATTNVTAPTEVPTINATTNVTAPTEVPTINATTNVTAPTEVPTINATTNVTAPTEVPTINATTNVTAPTEVPTINATTNVTAPTEVPTINATTNVTAPTEVPTINATTNVTGPLISSERNHTLDIVKKVLGIP